MGKAAVERALASGISRDDLQKKANKQGFTFAAGASDFLKGKGGGGSTAPSPTAPQQGISRFIGEANRGSGTFGEQAFKQAKASGMSRQDIEKAVNKAGLKFNQKLSDRLSDKGGGGTTASRTTPKIKGITQALKIAGEKGISKGEYRTIAEAKGKSPEKIIGKLDKINTKLEGKDKVGINLKSGAANMLVKKAQKYSDKYNGYRSIDFGGGAIGSTLQSMISTPANAGTWIKGKRVGGREADPGFNPGGKADKNRMIRGTVIRPDGKIAVKGTGKQYKTPKRLSGREIGPYDGMEIGTPNPSGPGPLANPNTETWLGNQDPNGTDPNGTDQIGEDQIETDQIGEDQIETDQIGTDQIEEDIDLSASSGAGGLDLDSWALGFRKARSARQKAGSGAQGLASQKKSPFKSWA